jgi:hypothetical protein
MKSKITLGLAVLGIAVSTTRADARMCPTPPVPDACKDLTPQNCGSEHCYVSINAGVCTAKCAPTFKFSVDGKQLELLFENGTPRVEGEVDKK